MNTTANLYSEEENNRNEYSVCILDDDNMPHFVIIPPHLVDKFANDLGNKANMLELTMDEYSQWYNSQK